MADKTFTLNTGQKIPAIGLGTWQSAAGEVEKAVEHALDAGYRLVDGAYCYGNEDEVGAGLKAAFARGQVRREDVFVTSKLWPTYGTRVELAVDKSLKSLGLDYLDLYMVHWPLLANPDGNHDKFPTLPDGERDLIRDHSHVEIWKEMEKLLDTGKVRSIGVSNYSKRYLEELLPQARIVPAVNQIENHPALPQQEIVDLCKEKGIHIMAYSPLGSKGSPLLSVDAVGQAAQKHNVSPSTILLSYHIARGSTVLAKSVTPERITANLKTVDLDLDDMAALRSYSDELTKDGKLQRFVYPPWKIDFGFPDKS